MKPFVRYPLLIAILLGAVARTEAAQSATPGSDDVFARATVKSHTQGAAGGGMRLAPGGGFAATGVTLRELVAYAYQRHPFDRREVSGGPDWSDSDRFDVTATGAREHVLDADGSPRRNWGMVRALLADRFKLKVHEESPTRPAYVMTMARADGRPGPQLRKTDADCADALKARPAISPGQPPPCSLKMPPGRLFASTITMATLASLLSPRLDRVVVDRTGLAGRFDVELEAAEIKAPPGYQPGPSDLGLPPPPGTSIFVAVREQLGLKLEPLVAPLPVVVIDHVEKPAPD